MDEHISVLVVDDQLMFAQALTLALSEEADIDVRGTAGSVAEAVAAAQRHTPDVVLMDYDLPDGNGAEATRSIRAMLPATKVVMITSFDDDHILIDAIDAGCAGFVPKTNAIEQVVSAVRAVAAGEALVSPSMMARLLPRLSRSYKGIGSDLTPREHEILGLLAQGITNQAIAERLVISTHTVRNHVQNILSKLHAHSKLEAVANAAREGLVRY